MLHLTTDRLAALGDELPTPAEATHLAACERCAHERAAYQALVALARTERSSIGIPLTRWDAIAGALVNAGPPATHLLLRVASRRLLQVAAGLLLVTGGAMLGRASAGADLLPGASGRTAARADASSPPSTVPSASDTAFASVDAARAAQQRSELVYQQAAAYLAQHDSAAAEESPVAYRSRLAALDRVISASRDAMRAAPHDPVINGYYLTTIGQREATLRQLNTSLPASLRLNSF
jgi:hypothetical protein